MKTDRERLRGGAAVLVFGWLLSGGLFLQAGVAGPASDPSNSATKGTSPQKRRLTPAPPQETAGPAKPASEERPENFFEFFLSSFNPDRVHYGGLMEQKRRALAQATILNGTRMTVLLLSVSLLISIFFNWRLVVTEDQKLRLAAEMMADIEGDNDYLRQVVHKQHITLKKFREAQESALWDASNAKISGQGTPRSDHHGATGAAAHAAGAVLDSTEVENLKIRNDHLNTRVQTLEQENATVKQQLERTRADLANKKRELKDQITRIEELETRLRELKESQAAQKNLLPEHVTRIQALGQEVEKRDVKITTLEQQNRNLTEQLEAAEKNISFLTKKNRTLTTDLEQCHENLRRYEGGNLNG